MLVMGAVVAGLLNEAADEIDRLKGENAELRQQRDHEGRRKLELLRERDQARERAEALQRSLACHKTWLTGRVGDLQTARHRIAELEAERDQARERAEVLTPQCAEYEQVNDRLRAERDGALASERLIRESHDELAERVRNLKEANENYREILRVRTDERDLARARADTHYAEAAALRMRLTQVRDLADQATS